MYIDKLFNERKCEMTIELRESIAGDAVEIRTLLTEVKLPVESVDGNVTRFFVAEENGRMLGIAGFEFYGNDALLRSVAIKPDLQRRGVGSRIVDLMIAEAVKRDVREIVLLTETARDFFLAKGFEVVDRSVITNDAMSRSSEFTYACPKSAVCMVMKLK